MNMNKRELEEVKKRKEEVEKGEAELKSHEEVMKKASLEELIEGTKESLKQAKEGETLSDEESIRERIEQYRQKS